MYKVGVIVSSGELIAYPWLDPKRIIGDTDYEFVVFQQEQYDRLFAEMALGAFDSVIF